MQVDNWGSLGLNICLNINKANQNYPMCLFNNSTVGSVKNGEISFKNPCLWLTMDGFRDDRGYSHTATAKHRLTCV